MWPHSQFKWALLLISISATRGQQQQEEGDRPRLTVDGIGGAASRFLFGNIWKYDEYCASNLTGPEKVRVDLIYQGFFNGSKLSHIARLEQPEEIQRSLEELVYIGLKARSSLPIICSVGSWGFADEETLEAARANRAANESDVCRSALHRMLGSMDARTMMSGGRPNIAAGQARLLDDWLQLNTFGHIDQLYPLDNHIWLGDYNACQRLPETRYCFGAVRSNSPSWSAAAAATTTAATARATNSPGGGDEFIRVGLCLPKGCDSKVFSGSSADQLMDVLNKLLTRTWSKAGVNLVVTGDEPSANRLTDVYCLPDEDSPLRSAFNDPLSTILILAAIIWIGVIAFTTISRQSILGSRAEQISRRIMDGFDINSSLHRFSRTSGAETNQGLVGLDFIKVLAIVWLMSSHNLVLIMIYLRNGHDLRASGYSSPLLMMIHQSQHIVIPFFLISGLLVGHKQLQGSRNTRSIQFTGMIVERYARLAPLYVIIYAFVKKFAHLMSSGPLWDYGVSPQSEIRQCMNESWLVPFLMLANFVPPFSHCILTGWHVANDLHIYLLVPLLLKVYLWSRRAGRLVAVASFATSHLYHYWRFRQSDMLYNFESVAREPFTIGARMVMERFSDLYVSPIGRFGTHFGGILLADLILESRNSDSRPPAIEIRLGDEKSTSTKLVGKSSPANSAKTKICFIVSVGSIGICCAFPAMPLWIVDIFGPYSNSLGYPSLRLANEIAWLYVLYYILKKQQVSGAPEKRPALVRIMARPFWKIAVKLNYSLVLIHFTVARYLIQSQTQLINFSWLNLVQMIAFNLFVTYCVAFVVHLIVEIPLMSLVSATLALIAPNDKPKSVKKSGEVVIPEEVGAV